MLAMASHAALDGPRGFSLALMMTASGGSVPRPCERSLAWAMVASVRIGAAVATAALSMNARRPITERSLLSSVTGIILLCRGDWRLCARSRINAGADFKPGLLVGQGKAPRARRKSPGCISRTQVLA